MVLITKLPTGILIQRDSAEIILDAAAIAAALPSIISALIDSGRALADARKDAFESGLAIGRERGRIEAETAQRIAAAREVELDEQIALAVVRTHLAA